MVKVVMVGVLMLGGVEIIRATDPRATLFVGEPAARNVLFDVVNGEDKWETFGIAGHDNC